MRAQFNFVKPPARQARASGLDPRSWPTPTTHGYAMPHTLRCANHSKGVVRLLVKITRKWHGSLASSFPPWRDSRALQRHASSFGLAIAVGSRALRARRRTTDIFFWTLSVGGDKRGGCLWHLIYRYMLKPTNVLGYR
jgi:hypothetical protein